MAGVAQSGSCNACAHLLQVLHDPVERTLPQSTRAPENASPAPIQRTTRLLLSAPIRAPAGAFAGRGRRRPSAATRQQDVPSRRSLDEADDLASDLAGGGGASRDRHALLPFEHLGLEIGQRSRCEWLGCRPAPRRPARDGWCCCCVGRRRRWSDRRRAPCAPPPPAAPGWHGRSRCRPRRAGSGSRICRDQPAVSHWLSVVCVVTSSFSAWASARAACRGRPRSRPDRRIGRLAHHAFRLRVALLADVEDHDSPLATKALTRSWVWVTSGQVASITCSPRSRARRFTNGETPCAVKMTVPSRHLVEDGGAVGAVQGGDAEASKLFYGEAVVNNEADDIDRAWQRRVFRRVTGDLHRIHDPVAVAARTDLDYFHPVGYLSSAGGARAPARRNARDQCDQLECSWRQLGYTSPARRNSHSTVAPSSRRIVASKAASVRSSSSCRWVHPQLDGLRSRRSAQTPARRLPPRIQSSPSCSFRGLTGGMWGRSRPPVSFDHGIGYARGFPHRGCP